MNTGQFTVDEVWAAIQGLLTQQLPGVDVDCIGANNFDEEGALVIDPPAARVLFTEAKATAFENQKMVYRVQQEFAILCADQDLGPDPQQQRNASIQLAGSVVSILAGARLVLPDAEPSDPIEYLGMRPIPTAELGMAYVVAFRVEGTAYYPGANANPTEQEN